MTKSDFFFNLGNSLAKYHFANPAIRVTCIVTLPKLGNVARYVGSGINWARFENQNVQFTDEMKALFDGTHYAKVYVSPLWGYTRGQLVLNTKGPALKFRCQGKGNSPCICNENLRDFSLSSIKLIYDYNEEELQRKTRCDYFPVPEDGLIFCGKETKLDFNNNDVIPRLFDEDFKSKKEKSKKEQKNTDFLRLLIPENDHRNCMRIEYKNANSLKIPDYAERPFMVLSNSLPFIINSISQKKRSAVMVCLVSKTDFKQEMINHFPRLCTIVNDNVNHRLTLDDISFANKNEIDPSSLGGIEVAIFSH